MNHVEIIDLLKSHAKPYKDIDSFSDKAGIYALFFYGKDFPFKSFQPNDNEIIYIGKTGSTQLERDAKTHFATGKTGSSTLRRTFGAFLIDELKLKPIPRSESDIQKKKYTNYKFDEGSEIKLTKWMIDNLGLSYYPYTKTAQELDDLETILIRKQIPLLNIDWKNAQNPYLKEIRAFRKQTGLIAFGGAKLKTIQKAKTSKRIGNTMEITNYEPSTIHKYEDIWKHLTPEILKGIKEQNSIEFQIGSAIFKLVGNRHSYSFNLEFIDGKISNNISGSAVARDLARVLEVNAEFKRESKGKHLRINLDNQFGLHVLNI